MYIRESREEERNVTGKDTVWGGGGGGGGGGEGVISTGVPLAKGMLLWELEGCHWPRGCCTGNWRGATGQGDVTLGIGGVPLAEGMLLQELEGCHWSRGCYTGNWRGATG